ncbi:3-deoxy-7-phosphoheptulonate synthase class II [soil metagenome]
MDAAGARGSFSLADPYPEAKKTALVTARMRELPPLVTSFEIDNLRARLASAERGERFVLWGGDCAETLADCRAEIIASKLKVMLQMARVIGAGAGVPVVKVGRMAGQYAKPRSSATETRNAADGDAAALTLPSYFGDLVNRPEFTRAAREADPANLLRGYTHAGLTLNFVRSLMQGGFADPHHPEYWDLGRFQSERVAPELRAAYERLTRGKERRPAHVDDALDDAEFFVSHEALNLVYEAAQTRTVPRHTGFFDLTTHLPWLGERTRGVDGPHVEFLRGIENPLGIKLGPTARGADVVALLAMLNPGREAGKIVLMPRLGRVAVAAVLPELIEHLRRAGHPALWVTDPMHGNTLTAASGKKTRRVEDVIAEIEASIGIHAAHGSRLGGIHVELTGADVTECIGGATGLREEDMPRNYETACDPRLNYEQSLEVAFATAAGLGGRGERIGGSSPARV